MQCAVCSVQCAVFSVQFAIYIAWVTLHSLLFEMYCLWYPVPSLHWLVCSELKSANWVFWNVHWDVCTDHCAVQKGLDCTAQFATHRLQCAVVGLHCSLKSVYSSVHKHVCDVFIVLQSFRWTCTVYCTCALCYRQLSKYRAKCVGCFEHLLVYYVVCTV